MSNKRHLLIFGMGYSASHLAQRLRNDGWRVTGTRRNADADNIAFDNVDAVHDAISNATHILSSVPPLKESGDPVLNQYADAIKASGAEWIGYLSSTGVYGDAGGGWVDESAEIKGRRAGRNTADKAWQILDDRVSIFRLPGIYGPGRSALERVASGAAHRIDIPDQIFSRIHIDDIASAIIASFKLLANGTQIYNISDDYPCGQNDVISFAAHLLSVDVPALQSIEEAKLSPMAKAFYAENRRVANGKAKRVLGWKPLYPTYREGLLACIAISNPMTANAAPPKVTDVQR